MIQFLRRRRSVRLFLVPVLSLCLASSQVRLLAQKAGDRITLKAPAQQAGDRITLKAQAQQAGDRIMLKAQAFDSRIHLTWTPVKGAEEYRIYRTPYNDGNLGNL